KVLSRFCKRKTARFRRRRNSAEMVDYSAELQRVCLPFLSEQESRDLLNRMALLSLQSGSSLYMLNDPADCLYLLVSGRIAVRKKTGFGDRMQVVALLGPGAPIGEGGLLVGQTRGATLSVVIDSRLMSLSRQAFDELSAADPALSLKLLKWLMGRVSLRLKKSSERLAHVL
ncbi:MAG: cAMP-binding protein, partial [uncultured bacterium]